MFRDKKYNYIGNTDVVVTDNFVRKYEEFRKSKDVSINMYWAGIEDITDIMEGNLTEEYLIAFSNNKN